MYIYIYYIYVYIYIIDIIYIYIYIYIKEKILQGSNPKHEPWRTPKSILHLSI